MSDKHKKHIRDIMMGTLDNISIYTMCGDSGERLIFSIPRFSDCQRCKERWHEEKIKDKPKHWFRLKMHGVANAGSSAFED